MTTHNSWCPYWIKRRIFMCHKQWKWGEIISDLKCIKAGIEMWSKNPTTSGLAAQWIQQKAYLTISDFSSPTSLPGWCKRCHFIWGGGTPWTSQSNMTISPTLQVLLLGSVLHLGGTGMMGKVLNDFSPCSDNIWSITLTIYGERSGVVHLSSWICHWACEFSSVVQSQTWNGDSAAEVIYADDLGVWSVTKIFERWMSPLKW